MTEPDEDVQSWKYVFMSQMLCRTVNVLQVLFVLETQ